MPKQQHIHKVLVIGSGPIVIGQAAEFDYSGAQACLSLKEEGVEVVLVNNNPATIMTDAQVADKVYLEPLTVASITKIIQKEQPDGLLPTLGGQTGLNLAVELAESGVLERYGVALLGTPLTAIQNGEDRELFKRMMNHINEPVPESITVSTVQEALQFANQIGYPVIVRPAYTLGGAGGGIAPDQQALEQIAEQGLAASPIQQVLVERSVKGWKEIEYEVMRDANDTCIIVCNMENMDPVGVHTGDSIVVAPSQTLTDRQYQMLRSVSTKVIRALGVVGGCNIQFALDPYSDRYYLIEVNPRVSRSSALASKATGYPIARIAAKLALGYHLDEVLNPITGYTYASFEPALDYVVVKIPRWPFDKFPLADRNLGTQMKATGEVMAIARTFEAALLKALRSLEIGCHYLYRKDIASLSREELEKVLDTATDTRLFAVAEALRRGMSLQKLHEKTEIDLFYLNHIESIIQWEKRLETSCLETLSMEELSMCKEIGFTDQTIAWIMKIPVSEIWKKRQQWGLMPVYNMVDTCAGEFDAKTAYYYSTWQGKNEVVSLSAKKILVLGSGPIRIGQGIEFDYCSVHAAKALQKQKLKAIVVNNNPETVSTDYETADHLYFEPLHIEDVLHVAKQEEVAGVLVQFGGQTAINLASAIEEAGLTVLGTALEQMKRVEDRELFYQLLQKLNIPHIPGRGVYSTEEAIHVATSIGYPVLLRPSYVIGGQGMTVVHDESELRQAMQDWIDEQVDTSCFPLLIDQFIAGMEVELDAISDGYDVLIPGIFEHVEKAGIHSGDSIALFPAQHLTDQQKRLIVHYTKKIAKEMQAIGFINIQFVLKDSNVYVLEVNPRASRTVPITSKVTNIPMVELAVRVSLGERLAEMGYGLGLSQDIDFFVVKAPVFSSTKLVGVDPLLGPEMKSTGEILGLGRTVKEALSKAFTYKQHTNKRLASGDGLFLSLNDADKASVLPYLQEQKELGICLYATEGTAHFLIQNGIEITQICRGLPDYMALVKAGLIQTSLITATKGNQAERTGFQLRSLSVQHGITLFTVVETFAAYLQINQEKESESNEACEDLGSLCRHSTLSL
ncbi:carbamoyl-phosphate synthase (glutamine-hydrolyzing) large subunit [Brevibacillus laterosporus]|uniref:Carbamoyl phosphate synthase large chain n=1 Tax=Brevibacillus laterosporus TaxID=1465 RepID=A0AAP3DBI3_BRELA|nr:carbamoyl-phosphate synthase (glutamine-hydrolyzing) large subunit [Brevibacillus laterosporus]MCR8978173.1 carbamoyl-phosphate synthase (glutamine-hydrolyzing) large subunit [Brevibacillus laterosporus]MCZ0805329.1 carbamoyl-phosphate synthase (glutamine-hydrolyzing) large subunit [Brevibacillus laterosporus]MCZ0824103.1 carbamoyl-phosphate synthase (glutamine-hydrolyzing) large subunit [Brevibacillus laterosporus]MCZ0849005.1 carbamoyl-phosphate synthase (glutamine-hydrolyzing) large subun